MDSSTEVPSLKITCAAVKTSLSEYKNPEEPSTSIAFGSPIASCPNSTAEDEVIGNSSVNERARTMCFFKSFLLV
jgi:hypothetical protein